MTFDEKPKVKDIYHYGVLGMKWGVRRTPEQLGHHKISKGTTMYRTTANAGESMFGSKYVTYLPPDRDLYRGGYSNKIRENAGKGPNAKVYEKQYMLKEDLNIPSRKTLQSAYSSVMSNENMRKKALTGFFESMFENNKFDYMLNSYNER